MTGSGQAKIAILNGQKSFIDSVSSVLAAAGYAIAISEGGTPALALITREKPDLIILELQPPDLSGYALMDILKAKGLTIPVLVATSPELIGDNLSHQGIAGLLIKPIDHERMLMHVAAILEIQKASRKAGSGETAETPAAVPGAFETAPELVAPQAPPVSEAPTEPELEPEPEWPRSKPLVLIVDDEPDMQTLLSDLLSFSGFDVATAGDGVEGLKEAQKKMPDAILLDIMLPKLDGFQMCRLLKYNEKYREIPIIMLTARNHPKDRELAEAAGSDGYIVKPFETKQLIAEIKRLIGDWEEIST
ncbi:MAG: response regulator [bacterium]